MSDAKNRLKDTQYISDVFHFRKDIEIYNTDSIPLIKIKKYIIKVKKRYNSLPASSGKELNIRNKLFHHIELKINAYRLKYWYFEKL